MMKKLPDTLPVFYRMLILEYGELAQTNKIARFNLDRLYHTYSETNKNLGKVGVFER